MQKLYQPSVGVLWVSLILSCILTLFLVAQTTEMTKPGAILALVSTGWTSKSLHMWAVTTFVVSVFTGIFFLTCGSLVIIIFSSMHLWHSFSLSVFLVMLVCGLPQLKVFLLKLVGWKFCVLVPHQMNLGGLWFTCHLLGVFCCSLWTFHFLGQLPDCACREFI